MIDRIQYGSTSKKKGSMTRYPGLNGAFTDHGTVPDSIVSAGAWPSGAPFKEDPVVDIPEVDITVSWPTGDHPAMGGKPGGGLHCVVSGLGSGLTSRRAKG
ncbi:MAG: hypothetical protein Ct9H300mP7_2460 [Verrucomicrobiota bacterium]|nr:MAG: hypothetical protein Ct9H300mP7_2460 [Verrucomicrobiota bacterium]